MWGLCARTGHVAGDDNDLLDEQVIAACPVFMASKPARLFSPASKPKTMVLRAAGPDRDAGEVEGMS